VLAETKFTCWLVVNSVLPLALGIDFLRRWRVKQLFGFGSSRWMLAAALALIVAGATTAV